MRDKQIQKVMQNAFDQMGYKFTSYDLLLLAKSNGVTDQNIKNGVVRRFLAGKAVNDKGPRQWIKNPQIWKRQKQENISEELPIFADTQEPVTAPTFTVNDAIDLLKANGYRIMKPKTDWEEL
jgi:hypothetical protein